MSRRIYRYRLDITALPIVVMPTGAQVLSVGPPRDGTERLDLWAVVDDMAPEQGRRFRIFGPGEPMPDYYGRFVGTAPSHEGQFIWHVFEDVFGVES